jgi:hypothetical protein
MQITRSLVLALTLQTLLTGCATITKDANQPIKIETYSKNNAAVTGAKCVGKNERGEFATDSTGVMLPRRSSENLYVVCSKDGEEAGIGTLISRVNGNMFGNILFGGGIGAIIDHNKGTAYNYPDWVRVIMGDNLVYDRKNNKDKEVMLGQASSLEELKKIELAKAAEEKAAIEKAQADKATAEAKTAP